MAKLFYDIRRKKCSLRRGPDFGLWLWFLTIQCSICFPGIFARCQGINMSLAVYPEGTIKLLYGQPVEIFCMDENYKADDLDFALGGNSLPSEKVNGTTRKFHNNTLPKGVFAFYCWNKVTNKHCTSRVVVDSVPLNVTDFACKSDNLDTLNCSWNAAPESVALTNYTLTMSFNNNTVESCLASKILGRNRYFCSWSTNSQPRYRQQTKQFSFILNTCNIFGCNEQRFTVDHFSIVKPLPVSNLKILSNGTHGVLLHWNIPNNMVDFLPEGVVHKIEYQIAKIDNTSYFRRVDSSMLPTKNKTYRFWLSDLPYAHMQYEVRIYIRPMEATRDEFWSKHTYVVFYTASERPRRPPDTVAGAFDQSLYDSKRRINVYWRQLEEYEEAGANFTYKVVAYEASKNPITLMADSKKRSYIVLDPASLGPINVYVWSVNDNGSSINSSHLYIPPVTDTEALKVPSFTKLAYENGMYKLSWIGIKNVDNYTLFWCQQNATKICTGRMNYTVLNSDKTEQVLDLPKENRYQFAISANKAAKTSGMVWAACDISKDGIPMYDFPVTFNHGAPGKSFVTLTWKMVCNLQEGIIKGYHISYCPVSYASSECVNKTFENKSVYIADPKQLEINITDLKPYRTYQFSLALNTTYGLKTIENAVTGVTTTEDTPTSPRNISISDVQNDSLVISWYPPLHKNGIIGKYVIYNYTTEYYVDKVPENVNENDNMEQRKVTLRGLQGFQNYSWTIAACNNAIRSCSQRSPSNGIFVRTRIGPPSKLKSPTIINNPDSIQWEIPDKPGGTVDMYQILIIKDDEMPGEILNTTNLSYSLIHCEGSVGVEKYQVRAVNYDEDPNYGILADRVEVSLPNRILNESQEYPGEWSDPTVVACRSKDGRMMAFILIAVFALVGIMYISTKFYKKYRKMEDIKPVLPDGLGIPEKDISKYAYGGWNPSNKDEKPSSDEMLLLPNSRAKVSSAETKQIDDTNCGSSDHTDSTVLSDTSRGPVDRQVSASDDDSESSLRSDLEAGKCDCDHGPPDEEDSSNSESEPSHEISPYFTNKEFQINPTSGYVQQSVANPGSGYVQSAPAPIISATPQPASSSYVMAALAPPIFTTGVAQPSLQNNSPTSGYVRAEDPQMARTMHNFANPKPLPTKLFGPESLPILPTLSPPAKHRADSSYIPMQSLDSLPSHKQPVRHSVPLKQPASSGYVSQGDAVINKHLNNMLSAGQLAEESAILDPTMSPDAYCRFSWSTDPANDNLHSLLADSPTIKSSKN